MNMKLTGLRDLLKAPQIREGLVITSFLRKSAWCEKNVRWDSEMAEYSTYSQAWKCWKNALNSRFKGANGIYTSYGFAFLFDTLSRYLTTSQKLIWGANTASKTCEMALKSKIHFQKLKKVRIFYPFPRLKILHRWKNRDYTTCPSDYNANLAIWVFCGDIGVILQKLTVFSQHQSCWPQFWKIFFMP